MTGIERLEHIDEYQRKQRREKNQANAVFFLINVCRYILI